MAITGTESRLYRKGLGLRAEVQEPLRKDFAGLIVDFARERNFKLVAGDLTFRIATELGFCYGVDRAVEYAYEARARFPSKRIFITGEIIHNPYVNGRLAEMGITFLDGPYGTDEKFASVTTDDVVLLPAFGVSTGELEILRKKGIILVDTTCGSVMNVWKNVDRYARDGFTSVVHGKSEHEETKATASRATKRNGHYIVVRDLNESAMVCDYIETSRDKTPFVEFFSDAVSPGFEPDSHLTHIGLANQTTMLSSESLEIAARFRQAIVRRFGESEIGARFRSFDTICSATQERQDAVVELCEEGVDLMLVIGGYNSSNTAHLAEICLDQFPTFHIADSHSMVSPVLIRHKPLHEQNEADATDWLPEGALKIGVTAGASTPDVKVDEVIERVLEFRGLTRHDLTA